MPKLVDPNAESFALLRLLAGLSHPSVAATLPLMGFGASDLTQGWNLLALSSTSSPRALLRSHVIAWAQRWLPLTRAVLAQRHGAVSKGLFHRISKIGTTPSDDEIGIFIRRVSALRHGTTAQRQAASFLSRLGLDLVSLAHAKMLRYAARHTAPSYAALSGQTAGLQCQHPAIAAYLQLWSSRCATEIDDIDVLQAMGIVRRLRRGQRVQPLDGTLPYHPAAAIMPATKPTAARSPRRWRYRPCRSRSYRGMAPKRSTVYQATAARIRSAASQRYSPA